MPRLRWPNIAQKLANSSKNSLLIAIEIHNKPICSYRLQTVVILIVHSWELLTKAYCYKYLKEKQILEKDEDNRYRQFSSILEQIYHSNPEKFRILYDNVSSLNEWRNILIHGSPLEDLDELVYEFITKSILLYKDFIAEFFPKDNLDSLDNIPLLPILFSLPFTTTDLLTKKSASINASKDVLEFLQKVQDRIKKLSEDWFEEMIFVGIRTEFTSEKKNADLVSRIENDNPDATPFRRDSTNRMTNDPSANPVRVVYNEDEKNTKFPLLGWKSLKDYCKGKNTVGQSWNEWIYASLLKELKSSTENIEWLVDTKKWNAHRYSRSFADELFQKYIDQSTPNTL